MSDNKKVPLMLGIRETAQMFGLPVHFVRALVSSGEVVAVRVGTKILVNVGKFEDYLNSNHLQPSYAGATDKTTATTPGVEKVKPRMAPIPTGRGRER